MAPFFCCEKKSVVTLAISQHASVMAAKPVRLAPEVNRALFVKNLPFKITSEEIFGIFGRYGALRQVRVGCEAATKGTAFVVYEDILDAKQACEHLSGFNVGGRYLVVHYFAPAVPLGGGAAPDLAAQAAEVAALRARVAAGEAAAAGGGTEEELDDEADRRRMARQRG